MAQLKDYKLRVRKVLHANESARNNDWSLFAHYINTFHSTRISRDTEDKKCIRLEELRTMPSMETLIRARRLIQNEDGEYLPTIPEVLKKRGIKQRNYSDVEVREAQTV
jgi:hypothetical protein